MGMGQMGRQWFSNWTRNGWYIRDLESPFAPIWGGNSLEVSGQHFSWDDLSHANRPRLHFLHTCGRTSIHLNQKQKSGIEHSGHNGARPGKISVTTISISECHCHNNFDVEHHDCGHVHLGKGLAHIAVCPHLIATISVIPQNSCHSQFRNHGIVSGVWKSLS